MRRFTRDELPPREEFSLYRKQRHTPALRIEGPFVTVTVDGNEAKCDDGWLAIDTAGYPYPIDKDVFGSAYEPATSRPWPRTGLSTAEWMKLPLREVEISSLRYSQPTVSIAALLDVADGEREVSYSGDRYPHVICFEENLYVEDGHHRVVVATIRGAETIPARVLEAPPARMI